MQGRLFWISYADLMNALFIIALAMFVLSYKMFKNREADFQASQLDLQARITELDKQNVAYAKLQLHSEDLEKQAAAVHDLRKQLSKEELHAAGLIAELNDERQRLAVLEEEYKKLQEIQKAIEQLDPTYFEYQAAYKRHVIKPQVQFAVGDNKIAKHYKSMLLEAGRAIKALENELSPGDNIKYMLVIEGMASKDGYRRNYELSYERALSLFRLWQQEGLQFSPDRYEIMIAGSGSGGVGRDLLQEKNNQRFLIQVIPKIGTIKEMNLLTQK